MADITIIKDPAQLDADLTSIGDSIRAKGGTTAKFNSPAEMKAAVDAISVGKPEQEYIDGQLVGTWPSGVVKTSNMTIVSYVYSGNTAITEFYGEKIKELPGECFRYNASIEILKLDALEKINGWNTSVFREMASLRKVSLPSLVETGTYYKFRSDKKLEYVYLPVFERSIRQDDFWDCIALKTLILGADTVVRMDNVENFHNSGIANGTGYVYVPRTQVENYKVATNWVTFASQIRAIEDYPGIIEEWSK